MFTYIFRSQETSKIFAVKYGIPNAFEGYEALAACDEVNVVYVGTINTTHLSVVKVTDFY
jgi:predicted dehydrogenase